ncbi:MAG: glycosyltransferase involved in cell wall biosynthesis [Planctomycetaceae bacterium]|jgi:glycosyltransferase involved in cell wall biosynthesis
MHRIAILIEYPTVNGGENSMLAVLRHLLDRAESEFEFCVLGPTEGAMPGRISELGIPIEPLNLFDDTGRRLPREQAIPRLLDAAKASGADIVHGNSLAMGRLLGAVSREQGTFVATSHLRDIMKLSRAAISDLNATRRLIAVSNATLQFHVGQGQDESIGTVIHNGIDAESFAADISARARIRDELGIPADAIVLLTVGQIGLRKGLDTLAAVGQTLAATRTGIHWLLAGERFSQKAESVEFEEAVLQTFSECAPAVKLHRLGYRRDIPELMRASDVLVHGARQEPLGRVLLEAAAAELAIVATDVGGTGEIIVDGESGLLVPADAPAVMTDAISRLVDGDSFRRQIAATAHRRIQSDFGIAKSAEALADVWKSVIAAAEQDRSTGV